jgi:hypothetical protein
MEITGEVHSSTIVPQKKAVHTDQIKVRWTKRRSESCDEEKSRFRLPGIEL